MESDNDISKGLGGWTDSDFLTTVSQNRGIGAHADVPDENRFVAGVVQLLRQRNAELERQDECDDVDIAIFVLKPSPPDSIINAKREPMIDNGLTRVVGRLWFTAAPVISAHYVDLPEGSDDGLFSYVTDEPDLRAQPTLVFDPRPSTPLLRWYPKGLREPDNMELKPLGGSVNPDEVFCAIDKVYKECFITPAGLPQGVRLWHNTRRYRPVTNAEALLQSLLKAALLMRFPFCTVRHEQAQRSGRTDLEIEESDPIDRGRVQRHAILELKVLRSHWCSGRVVSDRATREHIKEGVRQAAAYRNDKGSRWSALCCFDMRKADVGDEDCFSHVREDSESLQIKLRRWYLYASTEDYRRATTGLG